jgi:hypothetical protein
MPAGRRVTATLLLLLGAACSQSLIIPDRVPEPLIEPLPLRAGLYYTPAFSTYRHVSAPDEEPTWDISLGAANTGLFDRLGKRLFRETAQVGALPQPGNPARLDVIIEPAVDAFEISLPEQSTADQYAVWIRYTVRVYGPDGQLLTAWKLSGYGEAGKNALQPARSMEEATILAMRDAAATISIEFARQPGIDQLLREKSSASTD